jgi:hypothetical protein
MLCSGELQRETNTYGWTHNGGTGKTEHTVREKGGRLD